MRILLARRRTERAAVPAVAEPLVEARAGCFRQEAINAIASAKLIGQVVRNVAEVNSLVKKPSINSLDWRLASRVVVPDVVENLPPVLSHEVLHEPRALVPDADADGPLFEPELRAENPVAGKPVPL